MKSLIGRLWPGSAVFMWWPMQTNCVSFRKRVAVVEVDGFRSFSRSVVRCSSFRATTSPLHSFLELSTSLFKSARQYIVLAMAVQNDMPSTIDLAATSVKTKTMISTVSINDSASDSSSKVESPTNGQTTDAISSQPAATTYSILEQQSQSTRPLRVIAIGAGASALNFAHEVSLSDLDISLTCYDKNPSIGGTWYENRYPGCSSR